MKIDRRWIAAAVTAAALFLFLNGRKPGRAAEKIREIVPITGTIETSVSVTGIVQPQTRLEIKPPITGRVETVLVKEGQKVKAGDILATMSSTERAALLDAALSKGQTGTQGWEDVYKPIPLVAPIDGEVIVQTVRPGQAVTAADAVVVLSDRLIVQAQVDETDIGKVKNGQKAVLSLDAYPDVQVEGAVDHIYFESKTVNNVTIYPVDILPSEIPPAFRSGMSANVRIVGERRENATLLPLEAVKRGDQGAYVLVLEKNSKKKYRKRPVETGLSDDANVEIVSGLEPGERAAIVSRSPSAQQRRGGNPLVPQPMNRRPQQQRSS